jgi:solute carrier family 25 carnitine/acylcarnitine transporter 20/29
MADSAADVEAHEGAGSSSSAAQTAKDLFSGAAGGIAQVLIGVF